jgi:hypothetical protein
MTGVVFTNEEVHCIVEMCNAAIEQFDDALRICPNDPDAGNIKTMRVALDGIRNKINGAMTIGTA